MRLIDFALPISSLISALIGYGTQKAPRQGSFLHFYLRYASRSALQWEQNSSPSLPRRRLQTGHFQKKK